MEDTGIGIRPEDEDRLFIEFQQLDAGSTFYATLPLQVTTHTAP